MLRINDIKLKPGYKADDLVKATVQKLGCKESDILEIKLLKRTLDARKKQNIHWAASVAARVKNEGRYLNGNKSYIQEYIEPSPEIVKKRSFSFRPVVIGSGPAGLFAALTLAKANAKPILIERGAEMDKRISLVENFWNKGEFSPYGNAQFGEGGAGTFSDGKLTTGTKDKRIITVFRELVRNGAPEEILYEGKPHIGTDRLRPTVKNIRNEILKLDGTVIFEARFSSLIHQDGQVTGIRYEKDGETYEIFSPAVILAIGHSARDTFQMLSKTPALMCRKPFAVGMRVEHLQSRLNHSMYGEIWQDLPPADYKLFAHLPNGRTVYTFCMCPGGQVVAAASQPETVVTNGMSLFGRKGKIANSALLVNVVPEDFSGDDPLAGAIFQEKIEKAAYLCGGEDYKAPVSLVGDFLEHKLSSGLGRVEPTYLPGTKFAMPEEYLPRFVTDGIREGLPIFAQKISCFHDPDAILTGPETRSSSPVRICRGENLQSIGLKGLYPCGEGAGYAGGIVSAAVDGIRCGEAVIGEFGE